MMNNHPLSDKPLTLVVRISIPNDLFLCELKSKHRAETISEVVRKLFCNVEDLYRNGIDIFEISTLERLKKNN